VNTDAIASCPRWHPGIPSQIRLTSGVGARGKPFQRRHCTLCRALFAKQRVQRNTRKLALEPYGVAMGVCRLGWAAPELVSVLEL
jgi:hypothetical protein